MEKNTLKSLLKIANRLDTLGLTKEADLLDGIIKFLKKIAEVKLNEEIFLSESPDILGKIINLKPGEYLAMRSSPDSSSHIIERLSQGQEFTYLDEVVSFQNFDYLKIEVDGLEGWVSSSFVEYYDENGTVIFRGIRKTEDLKKKVAPSSSIISPISGSQITSKYGMRYHPIHKVMRMHRGVDLRAAEGTPILAPENGKVINIKPNNGSAGNTLYFSGSEGRVWIFMHLSSFSVKKEQVIKQGVEIAKSGKTGGVTGPHLHMELKINGSHVDPLSVISIPIRQNTPKKPNKPSPSDGSRLLT